MNPSAYEGGAPWLPRDCSLRSRLHAAELLAAATAAAAGATSAAAGNEIIAGMLTGCCCCCGGGAIAAGGCCCGGNIAAGGGAIAAGGCMGEVMPREAPAERHIQEKQCESGPIHYSYTTAAARVEGVCC
jgi:hypothetical protein